jgi:hypothetical protein
VHVRRKKAPLDRSVPKASPLMVPLG